MNNLLKINGVVFPVPDGGLDVTHRDLTNVYTSESGETTVEVVRENMCVVNYTYNALQESTIKSLQQVIKLVNNVTFYDPIDGIEKNLVMKATSDRLKASKRFYRYGLSVWSLTFGLEEM